MAALCAFTLACLFLVQDQGNQPTALKEEKQKELSKRSRKRVEVHGKESSNETKQIRKKENGDDAERNVRFVALFFFLRLAKTFNP